MSLSLSGGQLIGSRYRLAEKITESYAYDGVSAWSATDVTLKQQVRVIVIDSSLPSFTEILDAARRSALFDNPHIVKILSVGSHAHMGWIVTEVPLGASLGSFMATSPLTSEQAYSITGDIATILTAAASRGLRHLCLDLDNVRLDKDGTIYLDGLAIHAAMRGIKTATLMPNELNRHEVASLLSLYSLLLVGTGEKDISTRFAAIAGNAAFPQKTRDIFASELRNSGVLSTSELIRILAPWQKLAVIGVPALPSSSHQYGSEPSNIQAAQPASTTHSPAQQVKTASTSQVQNASASPKQLGSSTPHGTSQGASGAGAVSSPHTVSRGGQPDAAVADTNASPHNKPAKKAAHDFTHSALHNAGEKLGAAKTEWKKTQDKFLSSASQATSRTAHAVAAKTPQATKDSLGKQLNKISYIPDDGGPRRYNVTKTLIVVTIALLAAATLVASLVFFRPPKVEVEYQGPTGEPLEQTTIEPDVVEEEATTVVGNVTLLNPHAGNIPTDKDVKQDNPDSVALVADGNTATVWSSWWYPSETFTVGKDGIGLALTLKEPMDISNIHIQVNGNGGHVAWRNTDSAHPDAGDVIAESTLSTTTYLVAPAPMRTDTIILWFDSLPQDGTGRNRLVIAEIDFNAPLPESTGSPLADAEFIEAKNEDGEG